MATSFQGVNGADSNWGLINKIEVKASGGSFQDVGRIADGSTVMFTPVTRKGDPSDTDIVVALRVTFSFAGLQTGKSEELKNLDGDANPLSPTASFLYDTDCEVKFTFANDGRTLTIGAVSGYTLRIVPVYKPGDFNSMQSIDYTGSHVEPYTGGIQGKFSA